MLKFPLKHSSFSQFNHSLSNSSYCTRKQSNNSPSIKVYNRGEIIANNPPPFITRHVTPHESSNLAIITRLMYRHSVEHQPRSGTTIRLQVHVPLGEGGAKG